MKELDSKQRAFVLYAAEILKCKDGDELNKKIQSLSTDDLNQLTTAFDKIYNQQMENNTIMARLGTKLNYIKKLNNKYPEGYEVEIFRAGGKPCMRCKKMAEGAIPVASHKNGKAINDIKAEIAKSKCGSKMKKKKFQQGGEYNENEHAELIEKYRKGQIKKGSKEEERLGKLNQNSGHHEDGWEPKKTPKKGVAPIKKQQPKKHLNGGSLTNKFKEAYLNK